MASSFITCAILFSIVAMSHRGTPFDPSFELELPSSEKTQALRLKVQHLEIAPEDVSAGWSSDEYLNRFLIARGGDVDSAARMYEKTVTYRKKHGICRLMQTYKDPQVMHMCFSGGFVGVDREGFPVSVERMGNADAVGIYAALLRAASELPAADPGAATLDPFVTWMAWNHELQEHLMQRWCARTGRARGRITFIADLGGVSLRHLSSATLSVLKSKADLEVAHYPEIVRRVFLVNTPQVRLRRIYCIVVSLIDLKLAAVSSHLIGCLARLGRDQDVP